MEDKNENVLISLEVFEKLKSSLGEIKVLVDDQDIKLKIEKLLNIVDNKGSKGIDGKLYTLKETIYNKMKTTKDKDLNVKLYMLYRKLEDGKIDEPEALRLYEFYVGTEYEDSYI